MDVKREFTDEVEIPRRCAGCIHLVRLKEIYDHYSGEYTSALESGLNGTASERLVQGLVEYSGMERDEAAQKVADNPELVHETLMETIDGLNESREACASLANEMIDECPDGTFKLRATRNGKQVLVSLCMSEITRGVAATADGIEGVRVERNY